MGAFLLIVVLVASLHMCGVTICLFHRLTGWPCLTCGSTRAVTALVSGDVAGALRTQPFAIVGCALLTAAWGFHTTALFLMRCVVYFELNQKERRACWLAVVVMLCINWLYLVRCGV